MKMDGSLYAVSSDFHSSQAIILLWSCLPSC